MRENSEESGREREREREQLATGDRDVNRIEQRNAFAFDDPPMKFARRKKTSIYSMFLFYSKTFIILSAREFESSKKSRRDKCRGTLIYYIFYSSERLVTSGAKTA